MFVKAHLAESANLYRFQIYDYLEKKPMRLITRLCSFAVLLAVSGSSGASWYIGGSIGRVDYGLEEASSFDTSMGFELIVGNRVNRNLAIEASYIDFGEADDGIPPVWRVDMESLAFGALLNAPVAESLDMFVKFGVHIWDAEVAEDGFGVIAKDDGNDLFVGFGAAVKVDRNISIGARYNLYQYEIAPFDDEASMLLLNVLVGF